MKAQHERPDERLAAQLFAKLTHASRVSRNDNGSAPFQFDYIIEGADGVDRALEVTQHRDEGLLHLRGSGNRRGWNGVVSGLQYCWIITPEDNRNHRKEALPKPQLVIKTIGPHLAQLEREGILSFHAFADHRKSLAILALHRAGIVKGSADPLGTPGDVILCEFDPPAFWVNPSAINTVVEEHIRENATKMKLAYESGYSEVHLWIWLDPEDFTTVYCFREPQLPDSAPALPSNVTAVWVADLVESGSFTIRRVSPEGQWEETTPRMFRVGTGDVVQ